MRVLIQLLKNKYFHLLFLLLLAVVLKSYHITKSDIGGDECFSLFISQYSITEIIHILKTGDNPPLWEIILHFWVRLFNNSIQTIRVLPLFFNVITIIPIYLIGKKTSGSKSAVLASLLFIFSSFSLFIAQEARIYSLVGFFSTLSMYFFLELKSNYNSRRILVALIITNVILFYSHYLSMWILVVQCMISLASFKNSLGLIKRYFIHFVVFLLLISPFIPVLINRFLDSGLHGTWVPKVTGFDSLYFMLWRFFNKPIVVVLCIVLIIYNLVLFFKNREVSKDNKGAILHSWFWIPFILSFLLSFKVSFFLDRYLYFLIPGLYLSISHIIIVRFNNYLRIQYTIVFAFVLLMLLSFKLDSSKMGYSGHHSNTSIVVKEMVEKLKKPNCIIISCPIWYEKEVMYYFNRNLFFSKKKFQDINEVFKTDLEKSRINLVSNKDEIKIESKINEIVFFDNHCDFHCQNNQIYDYLNTNFKLTETHNVDNKRMYHFLK
jgi:mannosyltransferase